MLTPMALLRLTRKPRELGLKGEKKVEGEINSDRRLTSSSGSEAIATDVPVSTMNRCLHFQTKLALRYMFTRALCPMYSLMFLWNAGDIKMGKKLRIAQNA